MIRDRTASWCCRWPYSHSWRSLARAHCGAWRRLHWDVTNAQHPTPAMRICPQWPRLATHFAPQVAPKASTCSDLQNLMKRRHKSENLLHICFSALPVWDSKRRSRPSWDAPQWLSSCAGSKPKSDKIKMKTKNSMKSKSCWSLITL